jgi:hypothetical protein
MAVGLEVHELPVPRDRDHRTRHAALLDLAFERRIQAR